MLNLMHKCPARTWYYLLDRYCRDGSLFDDRTNVEKFITQNSCTNSQTFRCGLLLLPGSFEAPKNTSRSLEGRISSLRGQSVFSSCCIHCHFPPLPYFGCRCATSNPKPVAATLAVDAVSCSVAVVCMHMLMMTLALVAMVTSAR